LKNYSRLAFLFICLCIGITLITVSCTNKCGSITCQNGGTCNNNKCVCPTGYSGNACQTGWDDAAIGTYNCKRSNCVPAVSGADTWVSAVTRSSTNSGFTVNITNFNGSNTTVAGVFDSLNRLTIAPTTGSYGVDARGSYSSGVISLVYTVSSSSGPQYTCSMTMTKR